MGINKNEVNFMKAGILVGIAIMLLLCCTLPAAASDYTLGIFGNANEDDTIDVQDVKSTELIILNDKGQTQFADAKYDGKIDILDLTQIELIILGSENELTLIDTADRIVTVKKPVNRVILLSKYCVEAIQIFGDQDKIVGISNPITENTYLPDLSKLPSLGMAKNPDLEAIISLYPDLLITWWSPTILELDETLPNCITVVDLSFSKPHILVEEVTKLGYIFGKNKEASYYIDDFHDKYIDYIKAKTEVLSDEAKPKVYVECNKPYKTYGYTTGAHQSIGLAGGTNIFSDLKGIPVVDPEAIVVRNPDVIIKGAYADSGYDVDNSSKMKELRDEIMSRPGFAGIAAVKEGRVYVVDANLHYGLDYPIGIAHWTKCIHPDYFDLDPKEIHQEFMTDFMGVDYDLDEHGVFVYYPDEHPDGT
ncbi:MAG TPA: hypothetical protein C5S50_10235 [Methanosarcinaceae archaeon]|nr:hypothetical protein [Methanosarcinaceae archaeon]